MDLTGIGFGRRQSISAGRLPAGGGGAGVGRIASRSAGLRTPAGPRFRTWV